MNQTNKPFRPGAVEGDGLQSGDVRVDDEDRVYVAEGDIVAGKFRVDCLLGVGGMGFVVAATHLELDGSFALKFLKKRFLREKLIVERFTREAKAACHIRSEHVARVYDVGTSNGAPFLVMDHLVGRDLAAVLADTGWLGIDEAVEYGIQACAALTIAHGHGIIHRDIKPENLFLVEHDGHQSVKLLDFGISKRALVDGRSPVEAARITGSHVLGTPFYMSPEQIRSAASADVRSDIWSLGTVLYELLTSVVAFQAESVAEVCAAILERDPRPLGELRPDVPEGLAEVVARCLQKDPADRFRTVAELAVALLPFAPFRALAVAESSSSIRRAAIHALGGFADPLAAVSDPRVGALRASMPLSLSSGPPGGEATSAHGSRTQNQGPSLALARARAGARQVAVVAVAAAVLLGASSGALALRACTRGPPTDHRTAAARDPVGDLPSKEPAATAARIASPAGLSEEPAAPIASPATKPARPPAAHFVPPTSPKPSSARGAPLAKVPPSVAEATPTASAAAPIRGRPDLGY